MYDNNVSGKIHENNLKYGVQSLSMAEQGGRIYNILCHHQIFETMLNKALSDSLKFMRGLYRHPSLTRIFLIRFKK